jgi:hypothetical protein
MSDQPAARSQSTHRESTSKRDHGEEEGDTTME